MTTTELMLEWLKAAEQSTGIEIQRHQARLATLQQTRMQLETLIEQDRKTKP